MNNNLDKNIFADEQGFTLMETLVAVFILSIVSIVSLSIMSSFADANQTLTSTVNHLDQIQNVRSIINEDMRSVVKRTNRFNEGGAGGSAFFAPYEIRSDRKPFRLVRFTRYNSIFSNNDHHKSAIETVEYWVDGNDFKRRVYERPDPTEDTPYIEYVLLSDINDVNIMFFEGFQWVEEWYPVNLNDVVRLPKAVELSYNVKDKKNSDIAYTHKFHVGASL